MKSFSFFILSWLWVEPVSAHISSVSSLTSDWHWRLDIIIVVIILAGTYVCGWLRLRQRATQVTPVWQIILYLAAIICILLALISPIDSMASTHLSMHMVQHILLLMLAPLLFLLANPLVAFLWGLPRKWRLNFGRLFSRNSLIRRGLWVLTFMPVSWSLYVVNLWLWHHPYFYEIGLKNQWAHDIEHVLFFLTAVIFWWPVVNPAPRVHRDISYGFRIVYLIAATLQNIVLGMAISLPNKILYPFYKTVPRLYEFSPINDQALGGGIMWVSSHMYLIPILVLVARLLTREEEEIQKSLLVDNQCLK